ncbi:MAG: DNA translocase FtsK 4TM domain-containing protein [Gemmataceae bacterium]
MFERREYTEADRLDLAGFALLAFGMLVALSVFSYDGVDRTAGVLGPPGAWVAGQLTDTLGVAVYGLLAAWFVLVVLLFLRHSWLIWSMRLVGWIVLVPCVAVLSHWLGHERLGGPLTGPGGTLGAWLAAWLSEQLGPLPRGLALFAGLVLGVVLAADRVVFGIGRGLRFVGRRSWRGVRRASERFASKWPKHKPVAVVPVNASTLIEPISTHTPQPEPSVVDCPVVPIHRSRPVEEPSVSPPAVYELPPIGLLEDPPAFPYAEQDLKLRERAALLEKTFTDFGLAVKVVGINTGPVITQYEIALETGLRVSKVTSLADDLALNLRVPSVRIVAPIPGKNTVGIEVPNEHRATVRLKELLLAGPPRTSKAKLPLYIGKDTEGRPLVHDLADMPHLLIAGRTGTGKSVCLNSVILSLLMTRTPDECKLILIDPKMLELSEYGKIPHLMHPVVTDMKKAEAILAWAVDKMDERYDLLKRARVRGISSYNELTPAEIHRRVQPSDEEDRKRLVFPMPYIVIIIDEFGDLMMKFKKDVEEHIIRLAQKSRAAGIHLILATQKPTVDIVTGLIKSNLPARICFQVTSRTDSRVVLDEMGADKLLGKGDMLFLQPGTSQIVRAQGSYASDEEIRRVVSHIEAEPEFATELVTLGAGGPDGPGGMIERLRARDEVYEQAIEIVIREGRGSTSLLQRALGIGYGRAARLIDFMAEDGIVGTYNGSQAREVLYKPEQWEQMKQGGEAA